MRALLLGTLLLAASTAGLDADLEAYQQARRASAIGVVTGRVVAEPRTPRGSAQPLTGTVVALLPRSEALLVRLGQLKERSRESSTAFTAAAPAMRKAREAYERQLWEAGAADLATTALVDTAGGFRMENVPEGDWLVIAWHGVTMDVAGDKVESRERGRYRSHQRLRGFQSVTIWLWPVRVVRGETATLELTDRNGWFRGVIEERVLDTGR